MLHYDRSNLNDDLDVGFWDMTPCGVIDDCHGNKIGKCTIALLMEAASTFETLVNFYETTRRNNPEDSHLHTRRCQNLKSHK
jgi:hypothetical protein